MAHHDIALSSLIPSRRISPVAALVGLSGALLSLVMLMPMGLGAEAPSLGPIWFLVAAFGSLVAMSVMVFNIERVVAFPKGRRLMAAVAAVSGVTGIAVFTSCVVLLPRAIWL